MLGAGCVKCGCKPCVPCTAECDPNTPVGFTVAYSGQDDVYIGSNVSANPVNVVPTPAGPFYAEIATIGAITIPSDNFPCYFRLKIWRNVFEKNGTPSEALSLTKLRIACTQGKVLVNETFELSSGESILFTTEENPSSVDTYVFAGLESLFHVVAGLDDQSGNPPPYGFGASALCSPATVTVSARIEWTSPDIHHVLYGQLVECYDNLPPEDPNECLDCNGTPTAAPSAIYMTISNFEGGGAIDANNDPINYDGTYVLDLAPNALECARYAGSVSPLPPIANLPPLSLALGGITASVSGTIRGFGFVGNNSSGAVLVSPVVVVFVQQGDMLDMLCGGAALSGSYSGSWIIAFGSGTAPSLSFDWELST